MEIKNPQHLSILAYILDNSLVNEKKEPISFDERPFLLDIFTDWTPEQVYKKCAQVGVSVTMILKTLYAAKYRGWNIIYTLPTDDDVGEFVKSKTNKILEANDVFRGLNTDNIEMKEIGDRFIYYKGTVSKSAAIMTTADVLVHDEINRSSQPTINTYRSRTKASKYKGRWLLSNPSIEKAGVDEEWLKSDQKEWCITCNGCGLMQYLTWPDSIDPIRKVRQCKECHKALTTQEILFGQWCTTIGGTMIPWDPEHMVAKISGWHISQLICVWISAEEILEDSQGDQEYFYNFVLGEPYNPGDFKVSRSTILDSWTPKDLVTGEYFLGVDVGNIKHYALGSEKGVIQVGKFSNWTDLDDLLEKYKPITVIDALPDNTMAKYYVENYYNVYMWYPKKDKDRKIITKWGENEDQGVVWSDRNRIIDAVINEILNGRILFGLPSDFIFKEYIKHWETLRRVKTENSLGIEVFEWDSTTGVDHFVFATVYYYLATLAKGTGAYIQEPRDSKQPQWIEQTSEGPVVGDIKRIFEREGGWS